MKRSRFTEAQIIGILKEYETGIPVLDLCRIVTVVYDCTRECLCLVADTSLSGARLACELDSLITTCGKPGTIVSDNGTEMTSIAILKW